MYRALVSFTGLISMVKGEVREISDSSLADDLLRCHYIEDLNPPKPKEKKTKKKKGE